MKKLFFISIPSLLTILIVFLVVQFFILPKNAKGALQVTTSPQAKVYLDNAYVGSTPLCLCEAEKMIASGDHTLRLVPTGEGLSEYQQTITITKSVLTVVDRTFGKGATSEGSTISLSPLGSSKDVELLVTSIPPKADVYVDSIVVGTSPLDIKDITQSDHTLKIKKDGYNEKIVRIRTPAGYQLLASIQLSVSDIEAITPTPTPASDSASLTPSLSPSVSPPSILGGKVIILETPNGFLRVRESNSVDSPEIGRVNPGEEYSVLDEQEGWFQIKLLSGKMGWISGDYAKRK